MINKNNLESRFIEIIYSLRLMIIVHYLWTMAFRKLILN